MKVGLIVNDSSFCYQLKEKITSFCSQYQLDYQIISNNSLSSSISSYDFLFIDYDLYLKENDDKTIRHLIFIINHSDMIHDILAIHPFSFIRKNHFHNDLMKTLELMKDDYFHKYYHFQHYHKKYHLLLDDILYIEVDNHLTTIHTSNQYYSFYKPLKTMIKELKYNSLCQIHKKYYINLKHSISIKGEYLIIGNYSLPLGRKYKKNFLSKYFLFYNKKERLL